jgi:hypothetical protein
VAMEAHQVDCEQLAEQLVHHFEPALPVLVPCDGRLKVAWVSQPIGTCHRSHVSANFIASTNYHLGYLCQKEGQHQQATDTHRWAPGLGA